MIYQHCRQSVLRVCGGTLLACTAGFGTHSLLAAERVVATSAELRQALATADPGDTILLEPGTYAGGLYRDGLREVTLRSRQPTNRAIIEGGTNNLQLSNAHDVTIEQLVFSEAAVNGLNIDDGGSFASPTTNIVLRDIEIRDVGSVGNQDGIKLSGVDGFRIENVRIFNWGNGGSAIDMVGSHHGLIQNSLLRDEDISNGGTGIRPKGGSKDILIRANRVELPGGQGRAIQAGGSTGSQFFRFIDGDSGYEADQITAAGNVVIGGSSAFSWVNIDGGTFHHNRIQRPADWTGRILNENPGGAIVDTQNGRFLENIVVYRDTATEYRTDINVGPETLPETFEFHGNQWWNIADPTPTGSEPQLPVTEVEGVYGVEPDAGVDDLAPWEFDWGTWLVNATESTGQFAVADQAFRRIAVAGAGSRFLPLDPNPFQGAWTFQQLKGSPLEIESFAQAILVDCRQFACGLGADFDGNGSVDGGDFLRWQMTFPLAAGASQADGDADADGDVDGADFLLWQAEFSMATETSRAVSSQRLLMIAEPTAGCVVATFFVAAFARRRRAGRSIT